jgi:hypothetical protein
MTSHRITAVTSTTLDRSAPPQPRTTPAVGPGLPTPPRRADAKQPRAGLRRLAAAAAVLVAVISTGPSLPAAALPGVKFLDHHGKVLRAIQLIPIYWGSTWTAVRAPNPTADQITTATRTMLAGSYLTGLAQYRGIGHGFLRGSAVITTSDPPGRFTEKQVRSFLDRQLDAGTVPQPDPDNQTLYVVVMPTGTISAGNGFDGEHNYYTHHGRRIHYAWTAKSGRLDSATRILSHEIVEAATDPEGTGFSGVAGTCDQDGWCEIADACSTTSILDSITVWSYWSNEAGRCVATASPPPVSPGHQPGIGERPAAPNGGNTCRRGRPIEPSAHEAASVT